MIVAFSTRKTAAEFRPKQLPRSLGGKPTGRPCNWLLADFLRPHASICRTRAAFVAFAHCILAFMRDGVRDRCSPAASRGCGAWVRLATLCAALALLLVVCVHSGSQFWSATRPSSVLVLTVDALAASVAAKSQFSTFVARIGAKTAGQHPSAPSSVQRSYNSAEELEELTDVMLHLNATLAAVQISLPEATDATGVSSASHTLASSFAAVQASYARLLAQIEYTNSISRSCYAGNVTESCAAAVGSTITVSVTALADLAQLVEALVFLIQTTALAQGNDFALRFVAQQAASLPRLASNLALTCTIVQSLFACAYEASGCSNCSNSSLISMTHMLSGVMSATGMQLLGCAACNCFVSPAANSWCE